MECGRKVRTLLLWGAIYGDVHLFGQFIWAENVQTDPVFVRFCELVIIVYDLWPRFFEYQCRVIGGGSRAGFPSPNNKSGAIGGDFGFEKDRLWELVTVDHDAVRFDPQIDIGYCSDRRLNDR